MLGDVEENLLGYIIENPKLIDNLEIKPKHLKNQTYKKVLEKFIECYKLKKCLDYTYLEDIILDIVEIRKSVLYVKCTTESPAFLRE